MTMDLQKPKSYLCTQFFFIATLSEFKIPDVFTHGKHKYEFSFPKKESEQFDLQKKGIRIF